jgi:hypothetical protein
MRAQGRQLSQAVSEVKILEAMILIADLQKGL